MVPHLGLLSSHSTMSIVEVLSPKDSKSVEYLLLDLLDPENKKYALSMLPKKRGMWHSFGTIAALLQEIMSVYPALSSSTLSASAACNALGLLQVDDTEVVKFLLKSEGIPLCLQIMRAGSEISKIVATFIVQKIMLDEVGLQHICATPECSFFHAASVLASMVIALTKQPSTKLLKLIIGCYLRLTDDPMTHTMQQTHLHEALRDGTFDNSLRDDPVASYFLDQLLGNVDCPTSGTPIAWQAQTMEDPLWQTQIA